jgi:Bacterial membrane protein YfhO
MPGKTLSNSDTLWFQPPFVSSKPVELRTPSNPELGDATTALQPFVHHTTQVLPHIPLWDPYIAAGRPFAGNAQSAIFGPYSLLAYVLPFWTALGWIGVLKLWVAAFGTYLLGRALGMRFGGALLAGIVFALNLKMVTWLSYPHMSVWTFIPWLLLLTDRLVRRPSLLAGGGLAAVVAVQFLSGHPESSFHALLAATAFFVLRVWQAHRDETPGALPPGRAVLAFGGAVLGGAALAAVTLVPFGELLLHSADFRDRRGYSVDIALDTKAVIGLFLPDWWGRPTQSPIQIFLLERALYAGALPLMLAAAALVLRPRAERIAVALFGFVWFAVVLSIPPFLQLISRLPVFSSGHNVRLIILTMFSLSLLAGWGFDDLAVARRVPRRRRQLLLGLAIALFAVPLIVGAAIAHPTLPDLAKGFRVAWLFAHPPGEFLNPIGADVVRSSALVLWLTLAGAALLLIVLRLRRRLDPVPFVVLGVLLVCVDLFRAGMGYNPAIPRKFAEPPATGAIRFLERQGPARFASTMEITQNVIPFEFNVYEARGYDVPILQRYDRLWRRSVTPGLATVTGGIANTPLELRDVTPAALRTLRFLGVTHILRAKSVRATPPRRGLTPFPPLNTPGLKLVYDGRDARVYRVENALPRAFVVGAQRLVKDSETARKTVTSPGFDARGLALTEKSLPGLPASSRGPPAGSARIVSYQPERVLVRAQAQRPGLLVLGDNWFPGWKAEVDGRPAPIERVDYTYRGVRIGPGVHRVEFRYEPASWRIGWIVSVLSLAALAAVVLVGLWRRRSGGERRARRREPAVAAVGQPRSP